MCQPSSLLDCWTQENSELANKCIPPHADHAQLELSVVYNICICFISQARFTEAELLLTKATNRVLQMTGCDPIASDSPLLWRTAVKTVENTALHCFVLYVFTLQWAVWLATCQMKTIQEFQEEISSSFKALSGRDGNSHRDEAKEKLINTPRLVMDPRRLVELLQISTAIAQGAEKLNEGWCSEALTDLQAASSLPAPRALVAYTHLLSGSCLAHMSRSQMALQCYRKALETDSRCVSALYQSILVYRKLGNAQAEIQALRIMHSTLLLPSTTEPALASPHFLSPSLLLCSQSLRNLLSVPSALSVLHKLALKCVLHGRASEGVEHYLDLLAALHSEDRNGVHAELSTLPRLPQLYLEAGAALLMTQRSADCMVLCNEVIDMTLELLPEKGVLVEPEERSLAGTKDVKEEGDDKLAMLLWVAAAYFLQGQSHSHHKDWKQGVTDYTRCFNLLMKVNLKNIDLQPQIPGTEMDDNQAVYICILQRLKGLLLAGRGISFTQMDRLREALRDLQLSLQVLPEHVGAGLWCGEVLWRLGRKREAAACWEKTWNLPTQSLTESLPVYVHGLLSGPLLDSTELRLRIHEHGLIQ
ncbi:Fanconi anemia group G protein isoform X2 [Cololabis saira]|uniref:Fanconi anemia group G protein isoform X2 n=1 Tax=Cololabis saira TaxID=129043 RepID=UPI002AD268A6|nr:Fanconi anemia group G protein isoform X2 [Cololabis saira]